MCSFMYAYLESQYVHQCCNCTEPFVEDVKPDDQPQLLLIAKLLVVYDVKVLSRLLVARKTDRLADIALQMQWLCDSFA